MQAHIFKATTVKFGVKVRTCDFLPHAKVCKKIAKEDIPLCANLSPKLPVLTIWEL